MTTEQMGLIVTILSVLVTALGVLFAIGAIVVAVLLFKQSREHRQMLTEAVEEFRSTLKAFIAEKDAQFAVLAARAKTDVESAKQLLEETTGQARIQQEERIRRAEELLATIEESRFSSGSWLEWAIKSPASRGGLADAAARSTHNRMVDIGLAVPYSEEKER